MKEYKYILEPYNGQNTRFLCPNNCKKQDKTFTRYIDKTTNKYVHISVGRCNRESKCGYNYTPKQYFQDNGFLNQSAYFKLSSTQNFVAKKQISYIPDYQFKNSLRGYESNCFINYLIKLFGVEITNQLISKYFIGTSKYWFGSTVFWQVDENNSVRAGKIMLYDPVIGRRIKKPYNYINWVHKVLKYSNFELGQCLFGEHLLKDKAKVIALVESEKTAIICSVYFPQFIWMAIGSLNNLNVAKVEVLKNRFGVLFPDLNGFDKWNKKVKELSKIAEFKVSDLLERKATKEEKQLGLDLADYLIRFDYTEFNNS